MDDKNKTKGGTKLGTRGTRGTGETVKHMELITCGACETRLTHKLVERMELVKLM